MSKEIMDKCLDEAVVLMKERGWPAGNSRYLCISILATALYQERMREGRANKGEATVMGRPFEGGAST